MDTEEVGTVTEEAGGLAESAETQEEETITTEEETEASTDNEGGSEEESDEDSQAESEETKGHKKDAQARIQELANKNREMSEKLAQLEGKFQAEQEKAQTPARVNEQALNQYLGELRDEIDTLRLEGSHLQAEKKERERDKLIDAYEKHTAELAEYEKKSQGRNVQQEQAMAMARAIEEAASFYAKENKIPQPVFDDMGKRWRSIAEGSAVVQRKFAELARFQGPVSAIEYAYNQVKEAIKMEESAATETKAAKEAGKAKQVTGSPTKSAKSYGSYDDLLKADSKSIAAYKQSNPKQYQKLLDAAMK